MLIFLTAETSGTLKQIYHKLVTVKYLTKHKKNHTVLIRPIHTLLFVLFGFFIFSSHPIAQYLIPLKRLTGFFYAQDVQEKPHREPPAPVIPLSTRHSEQVAC